MSNRLLALEALVAADPDDPLGRYLLGQEYLAAGRAADAARELERYCERYDGDKGMAYVALALAREALGDRAGARAAIDAGVSNATAHRHRQLVERIEAERTRLEEPS